MKFIKLFLTAILCAPCALNAAGIGRDPSLFGVKNSFALNKSDYSVTERDGAVLNGIAACFSQGAAIGATQENIAVAATNKHCWCRLIVPATSLWTYAGNYESMQECTTRCGELCASYTMQNGTFRKSMFESVP